MPSQVTQQAVGRAGRESGGRCTPLTCQLRSSVRCTKEAVQAGTAGSLLHGRSHRAQLLLRKAADGAPYAVALCLAGGCGPCCSCTPSSARSVTAQCHAAVSCVRCASARCLARRSSGGVHTRPCSSTSIRVSPAARLDSSRRLWLQPATAHGAADQFTQTAGSGLGGTVSQAASLREPPVMERALGL